MKRLFKAIFYALGAYLIAAVLGYFLLLNFSSNQHDRSLEAAMTSAFVCGPLGAILGIILAFVKRA